MSLATVNTLIELEKSLIGTEIRECRPLLESLVHPQFFEYDNDGKVWSREEIIEVILSQTGPGYDAFDFEARQISGGSFLLNYKTKTESSVILRSSIWTLDSFQWKIMFHQATSISD